MTVSTRNTDAVQASSTSTALRRSSDLVAHINGVLRVWSALVDEVDALFNKEHGVLTIKHPWMPTMVIAGFPA